VLQHLVLILSLPHADCLQAYVGPYLETQGPLDEREEKFLGCWCFASSGQQRLVMLPRGLQGQWSLNLEGHLKECSQQGLVEVKEKMPVDSW
jgi:hypothetical protein